MNNEINNETRKMQSTIEKKIVKQDRNNNEYLILNLANGEGVFCFPNQEKYNLDDLSEGHEYDFVVKEGRNSTNILVSFTKNN